MYEKILVYTLLLAVDLFLLQNRGIDAEVWNDVRLVNGTNRYEGRVEVKVNGTWGTVCDDMWSPFDGYVVCRQLGFDTVLQVLHGSSFGAGKGPIFHDDLRCTRHEDNLSECPGIHDPSQMDCTHVEDAGVRCRPPAVNNYRTSCNSNQYQCPHVNKCIPHRWVCDGHDDCGDKSDEHLMCNMQKKCGTMSLLPTSRRIVGGKDAHPGSWPWMTSIIVTFPSGIPDRRICGGTLIHSQWVLTAAHCFDMYKPTTSLFHVILGDYNQKVQDSNEKTVNISHVFIHDQYKIGHHDNDIALIRLVHQVSLATHSHVGIHTACLPILGRYDFGPEDTCFITGWGQTHASGSNTILQQAQVPIIDRKLCNSWYTNDTITDNMICAGYQFGGIDACHGDSGGPLQCKKHNRWYVAGIVSWGNGCAQAHQPGIYVNVKVYYDWILQVIKTQNDAVMSVEPIVGK